MPILVKQRPYYYLQPVGTPTVYTVEATSVVLNESNVKFICEVMIGRTNDVNTALPVATLKASPNRRGVGMFDVSPVVEAYVKPQHEGREGITTDNPNQSTTFKGTKFTNQTPHPVHCIDQFSTNTSNLIWYKLRFRVEYLNTANDTVEVNESWDKVESQKLVYNGVLTNDDPISYTEAPYFGYYYDLQDINYENGSGDYIIRGTSGTDFGGKFLTNMPANPRECGEGKACPPNIKIPMGENDYGTMAFFNCINSGSLQSMPTNSNKNIWGVATEFYDINGTQIVSYATQNAPLYGGKSNFTSDNDVSTYWVYYGHGLGNFKGRGGTIPANAVGYRFYATDGNRDPETNLYDAVSRKYDFEIIYDDCRGFEPVRLCWQNRLGAWDYYTFNLQSKKTVKTKAKTYQQLSGTWNEEVWRPKDHLGGQKVFTNTAVETWTINSDYMHEDIAAWLQELFESSEVYVVNSFYATNPIPNFTRAQYIHKYIEPVILKSTTYTKKTRANDGLIQYNVKFEKSKRLNIQRA